MQATAHSRVANRINPIVRQTRAIPPRDLPCPPNSTNRRCPATMFAANRTAKVPGRITSLTVSIITITGIKGPGVPSGTKWAKLKFSCLITLRIIFPNHKGKASLSVNLKCLEEVNTYGIKPKKLVQIININILSRTKNLPGLTILPKIGRSWSTNNSTIHVKNFSYLPFTSQYPWGKINRTDRAANQFPLNSKITSVWGLNDRNRSPIELDFKTYNSSLCSRLYFVGSKDKFFIQEV